MLKPETVKTCSICQCKYTGWGNNAQPFNDGRCCDDCNQIVIFARMRLMQQGSKS